MDKCANCHYHRPEKGRAFDGRRAYRCPVCGNIWTEGMQGRKRKYNPQRDGYQFADTGAKQREIAVGDLK